MRTQINERYAGGQIAVSKVSRHTGDQDLAPVADREQPCDAIECGPKIIAVALVGGAGMNRGSRAQPVDRREIFGS